MESEEVKEIQQELEIAKQEENIKEEKEEEILDTDDMRLQEENNFEATVAQVKQQFLIKDTTDDLYIEEEQ